MGEGILPHSMTNLPKTVHLNKLLIKMNQFLDQLQIRYTNLYLDDDYMLSDENLARFNNLMQEAHDEVITRLRNDGILLDSDFIDGTPILQEYGYSYFSTFGLAIIKNK